MPRKTHTDKPDRKGRRSTEQRTHRPKPKIDFTADALDFKNVTLLRQFVTDQINQQFANGEQIVRTVLGIHTINVRRRQWEKPLLRPAGIP